MGKKVLQFGILLMGVSGFLSFIAIFLPLHRVSMFLSLFKLGTVTTYTLRYYWHKDHVDRFCGGNVDTWYSRGFAPLCNTGSRDLLHVKEHTCNPPMQALLPELCEGFVDARAMGLTLVLCIVTQVILQVVACFLAWQYTTHSPKKKYRDTSLMLMLISAVITWLALMFYFFFVIQKLNNLHSSTLSVTGVISFSQGAAGAGYIIMWVSVILQIIATILFKFGKVKEERMLKEAKNEQRFEQEMAMHGGAFDPYQPASYGPGYGSPGGFGDPYAQQGNYGVGSQGFGPQGNYGGGYPPQQDPYAQDPYAQPLAPPDPYAQQAQYGGEQGQYGAYDPTGQAPMQGQAPYDQQQQPGGAPYWPAA